MEELLIVLIGLGVYTAGVITGSLKVILIKTVARSLLHIIGNHLARKEYFSPFERAIIRESQKRLE